MRPPSTVRGRRYAWLHAALFCAGVAALLCPASLHAQSFTWGGAGSTTTTSSYSTGTNWSNPGASAPPIFPTQSAVFGATGSATISIGVPPMLPDSWTFSANAQSYTISGNEVDFSLSGPTGGLINNANTGQTITISTNINDAGGGPIMVQQLGNSTLVLSGTNGYSGGTLISAGTVQVTNANSVGTGTITLNGGTFQMQSPTVSTIAFSNNIAINAAGGTVDANGAQVNLTGVIADGAGAGVLRLIDSTHSASAFVRLSGINTYSGGTLVNGTTVVVSNSSSVGTGTVTIGNNGAFKADGASNLTFTNNIQVVGTAPGAAIDSNGTTLTIAGNISGSGKLTILDATFSGSTVLLTGNNTYTGGTVVCNCATLALGDATHVASIVGAVTNEGTFFIANANTSGLTSIKTDGGATIFQNSTTAGDTTLITQNVGLTQFIDSSSAGNANITNRTGGTLEFGKSGGTDTATAGNATILNNAAGTYFLANSNAGTANITNRNTGAVIFGDQSSAASATITNETTGATEFLQRATAGNATIITNSGATTSFFNDATGGNAQFITYGTGYVDFSQTLGANQDGRITAGSIAGSGLYYIGGGNILVVGGNNLSTTVSGVIADDGPCGCAAGAGSLDKIGTGVLTLTGVNTYTGSTTVDGGTLEVDGSIAASSAVFVNSGGMLSGTGIVDPASTQIANGGTLAPGSAANPTGTLTITGSLAFASGATYLVQTTASTASKANVAGTAFLAGQVIVDPLTVITRTTSFTVLAANALNGTFGSVSLGNNFASSPVLSYVGNNVVVTLGPGLLTPHLPGGTSINQRNVAGAIDNAVLTSGSLPTAFNVLYGPSGSNLGALTQGSGELGTGSQQTTFDAMGLFMGLLTDPFMNRGGGFTGGSSVTGYAGSSKPTDAFAMFTKQPPSFEQRWSVWASGYGGSQNTDGNAALGSNGATSNIYGTAVGADYLFSPNTIAGFAVAGGGTSFSVANGGGAGRSDLFQAGAYVRHTTGPAYISAALAYGWQDVTTNRTVMIAGTDQLRAEFNANAYSGRLEGGYRFVTPIAGGLGVTPYAAAQFVTFDLPAYAEQAIVGTNNFALAYGARSVTDARTELGVRSDKSWALANGVLTLRGRLAWAHDYDPNRTIGASFQTLPGASFVVNGAAQAADSALTTAALEMKWQNGWSAAATFEGEFSSVTTSYAGKGVVRYQW